jgi:hypothetical protein
MLQPVDFGACKNANPHRLKPVPLEARSVTPAPVLC